MEISEIKGWFAYYDALKAYKALEIVQEVNGKDRPMRRKRSTAIETDDKGSGWDKKLFRWAAKMTNNPDLNHQTVRQEMKSELGVETEAMTIEELMQAINIRIQSLQQTEELPQSKGTNEILSFNKKTKVSNGYVDTIYLPKMATLINNQELEIEAELVAGVGDRNIDITIPKGSIGVYTINSSRLKEDYTSKVKEHNGIYLGFLKDVFIPFNPTTDMDRNVLLLKNYIGNARSVIASKIKTLEIVPNYLTNLSGLINEFDSAYLDNVTITEIDEWDRVIRICRAEIETEEGHRMDKDVHDFLRNIRVGVNRFTQEGVDERLIKLMLAVYQIPLIEVKPGLTQRITVPILSELSKGVFITQETNISPVNSEIGRHILAEPYIIKRSTETGTVNVEPRKAGQGIKILTQELNIERETRELVNENYMTNDGLKKYIRRRLIESSIDQTGGMPSFQNQILTQILIEEGKSLEELKEKPHKLALQILTSMHTIITSVEKDTRRLSKFFTASQEHFSIDIDDNSIYRIVPILLLIDEFLGNHNEEYTDVAKQIDALSDEKATEFLERLLNTAPIEREETIANDSEIMKLSDELATKPLLLWGTKSKVGYDSYLGNLIRMITHKTGSNLTRTDREVYISVFKQVLGVTPENINEYYYYETEDINMDDINSSTINQELLEINAHLALVCQKTGLLKDVGVANINFLTSYDLKKIPSMYLTMKALENTMEIDIIRDYNLMSNIIQKHLSVNKDSTKNIDSMVSQLVRFFNRQVGSKTFVSNLLQKVGLADKEEFQSEIERKLSPFNDIEKYLILYNATKFSDVPVVSLQDYYKNSKTKEGVTEMLEDLIIEIELLQVRSNSLSQLPPLLSYSTILPKIMELDNAKEQILQKIDYKPAKVYTPEEIDQMDKTYLRYLKTKDRELLKEFDYEYLSFEVLTIYTPEIKGEFSTQALQERHEEGSQPVNIELLFGKEIEEGDFNDKSPDDYAIELLSGLPEGEQIYLPYQFRVKLVEFAESTVDPSREDGSKIRNAIMKLIKEKVSKTPQPL